MLSTAFVISHTDVKFVTGGCVEPDVALPSICMKTISTAAYAAVAATTSKGLLTVAVDMMVMNTQMKPVMIFNLVSLVDTNSSHHIGASSMANPINMMNAVVNVSNLWVLEYIVAADLICRPSTSFALNILHW